MSNHNRLSVLDGSRNDWTVNVRIVRMWPLLDSSDNSLFGFNLLLLDSHSNQMHAFVFSDVWDKFQEVIVQGNLYTISDFVVEEANRYIKAFSSNMCIKFNERTKVQELNDHNIDIPRYRFHLLSLYDVIKLAHAHAANRELNNTIDVIGVVEKLESVKVFPSQIGDQRVCRFMINDGSDLVHVSVWGDQISKLGPLIHDDALEKPVIAILASVQVHLLQGDVVVGVLPSSEIYFNIENDEVIAMRQRVFGGVFME